METRNNTNEWIPITYRDFWDLPRIFLAQHDENIVLFDCAFDEETEDYCDEYDVYLLPALSEREMDGSWHDLPEKAICRLGSIPINGVVFDQTRRQAVSTHWLNRVLSKLESPSSAES